MRSLALSHLLALSPSLPLFCSCTLSVAQPKTHFSDAALAIWLFCMNDATTAHLPAPSPGKPAQSAARQRRRSCTVFGCHRSRCICSVCLPACRSRLGSAAATLTATTPAPASAAAAAAAAGVHIHKRFQCNFGCAAC